MTMRIPNSETNENIACQTTAMIIHTPMREKMTEIEPTPQTHPDMEGFEDPGYLLAISPKSASPAIDEESDDKRTDMEKKSIDYTCDRSPRYSVSLYLRSRYSRNIRPILGEIQQLLPSTLRYKGPARTNLVLSLALLTIAVFELVTKAPPIGAAVFSFTVFGVLGPLVG